MKAEFIKQVIEVLTGYGFSPSEGDEWEYRRLQTFIQPGQVIVINGQQMQQPSQEIEVKHVITEIGDGYYENSNGTCRVDLIEYNFQVYVKDDLQAELTVAYDYDDIEGFKIDLQNILRV
jgi:hypothetical protein